MKITKEKCAAEPRGLDSARMVTVIETKEEVGHGTPEDPFRIVVKYWGVTGELLGTRIVQCTGSMEAASSTVSSIPT